MTLSQETDPACVRYTWPHFLFDAVDLFGPSQVYAIGLETLEYPPTWISTYAEAERVQTALITASQRKYINGT